MKKIIAFILLVIPVMPDVSLAQAPVGGYQIRRADTVQAAPEAEGGGAKGLMNALTSPGGLATAMGLIGTVTALRTKTTELRRECEPSLSDITFINQMVQEYAKLGRSSAKELIENIHNVQYACPEGQKFKQNVKSGMPEECVDIFRGTGNNGKIWFEYPMADKSDRMCPSNNQQCNEDRDGIVHSNAYRIYMALGWEEADLLPNEIANHTRLIGRASTCDPSAVKRRIAETTMSGIMGIVNQTGQSNTTGTANGVMEMVQGMGSSGGSPLNSIMNLAPSVLGASGLGSQ